MSSSCREKKAKDHSVMRLALLTQCNRSAGLERGGEKKEVSIVGSTHCSGKD